MKLEDRLETDASVNTVQDVGDQLRQQEGAPNGLDAIASEVRRSVAINEQEGSDAVSTQAKSLNPEQTRRTLAILESKFREDKYERCKGINWDEVVSALKLEKNREKLWSIHQMQETGHNPMVWSFNEQEIVFMSGWENVEDCQHTNLNYRDTLKIAKKLGIDIFEVAQIEEFEKMVKTSDLWHKSWAKTEDSLLNEENMARCVYRLYVNVNSDRTYAIYRSTDMAFRGALRVARS